MAYLVTLATLMERTLQRANLEGVSRFIKPYELTEAINGSIAEFADEVRGTTWNGSYSRASHIINTSGGTRAYPLPQDFLTLLSADTPDSLSMRPYQEEERNAFSNLPIAYGWCLSQPVYYQIQGTDIAFMPIPQGTYAVTVNYIPTAPVLSDPQDTIDSINGWEEFIVLDAAIKLLMKAGGNDQIPVLADGRERQRSRIRSMAPKRDQHVAERVHVITNVDEWWDYW